MSSQERRVSACMRSPAEASAREAADPEVQTQVRRTSPVAGHALAEMADKGQIVKVVEARPSTKAIRRLLDGPPRRPSFSTFPRELIIGGPPVPRSAASPTQDVRRNNANRAAVGPVMTNDNKPKDQTPRRSWPMKESDEPWAPPRSNRTRKPRSKPDLEKVAGETNTH